MDVVRVEEALGGAARRGRIRDGSAATQSERHQRRRASTRRLAARVVVASPCPVRTRLIPSRAVCRQGRRRPTADAVDAYATHLRVERHASPHTLRAYLADVRQFLAVAGRRRPRRASRPTPSGTGCARSTAPPSARRSRASSPPCAASSASCTRTRRLARDPTAGIATPKTRRTLPTHLTLDDVDRLLGVAARRLAARAARPRHPRAALLLRAPRVRADRSRLGAASTPRAAPCACSARGARSASCPVGRPALRALASYRAACAAAGPAASRGPVFRNARGGRLTSRSVARLMARYVAASRHARQGHAARAPPHLRHPPPRRAAPTCAPSRSCSATRASPPRSATPTSISAA